MKRVILLGAAVIFAAFAHIEDTRAETTTPPLVPRNVPAFSPALDNEAHQIATMVASQDPSYRSLFESRVRRLLGAHGRTYDYDNDGHAIVLQALGDITMTYAQKMQLLRGTHFQKLNALRAISQLCDDDLDYRLKHLETCMDNLRERQQAESRFSAAIQDVAEKEQQALGTLSQVSKVLQETALAVVRELGK